MCRRQFTLSFWALFAGFALTWPSLGRGAVEAGVYLLLSEPGQVYQDVAEAFRAQVGGRLPIITQPLDALKEGELRELDQPGHLLVPVGMRAVRRLSESFAGRAAVLALLVPKAAMDATAWNPTATHRVSAVYLDQPVQRSLSLIAQLMPPPVRVGMIVTTESARDGRAFVSEAISRGMEPAVETASSDGRDVSQAMQRLLRKIDVLLLVPDSSVLNESNAHLLLVASYRKRVPVVAFSRGMVNAGAVAAVVADPVDIGREGAAMASLWNPTTGALPPPRHTSRFSLAVNRQVARSLGLTLEGEEEMVRRLREVN